MPNRDDRSPSQRPDPAGRSRRSPPRPAVGLGDRTVGVALLLAAAAASAFGLDFGLSRLAELPGDGAARLVYRGERPTEEGYLRLLDSREAALRRVDRSGPHRDLGHAYHALASDYAADEDIRTSALQKAARELLLAIGRSPADPPTLAVLAATYSGLERDDEARLWLATARLLAPFSPETAAVRTWVAIVTGPGSTAPDAAEIRDVRAAFQYDGSRFVDMIFELGAQNWVLAGLEDGDRDYRLRVAIMRAQEERLGEAPSPSP